MQTSTEEAIANTPLNLENPIDLAAEEYWCAMKILDELEVSRDHEGKELSLVGRIRKATGTFIDTPPVNKG